MLSFMIYTLLQKACPVLCPLLSVSSTSNADQGGALAIARRGRVGGTLQHRLGRLLLVLAPLNLPKASKRRPGTNLVPYN